MNSHNRFFLIFIFVLIWVFLISILIGIYSIEQKTIINSDDIQKDSGYAYYYKLSGVPYSESDGIPSPLKLTEDGMELLHPHSIHDDIRQSGKGRYSHWDKGVFFSTSDNSDPRTNGRIYELTYIWLPSNKLLFGMILLTCLTYARYLNKFITQLFEQTHPVKIAIGLIVLALFYRIGVAINFWDSTFHGVQVKGAPFSDAFAWWASGVNVQYGQNIFEAVNVWDARRQGYAWFLGSLFSVFDNSLFTVRAVQILMGALSAGILFDVIRRMVNIPIAFMSSLIHVFLIWDARSALTTMSEPLGYFLSNVSIWLLVIAITENKNRCFSYRKIIFLVVISGAILSAANLVRTLNLLAIPVLGIYAGSLLVKYPSNKAFTKGISVVIAFAIGAGLVMSPWLIRQYNKYGILAISDNSAEMFYAATSPEYGTWSSKISALPVTTGGVTGEISDKHNFYSEGIRENLQQHWAWYLNHAMNNFLKHAEVIAIPLWLLILVALTFLLYNGISSNSGKINSRVMGIGIAFLVLIIVADERVIDFLSILSYFLVSIWAIFRLKPLGLLSCLLIPTLFSLAMVAASTNMRFDYSLLWLSTTLTVFGFWFGLNYFSTPKKINDFELVNDSISWDSYNSFIKFFSSLTLVIFFIGSVITISNRISNYNEPILISHLQTKQSNDLINEFLNTKQGQDLISIRSHLNVVKTSLVPDHEMYFVAHENIGHWSPLFEARPYNYLVQNAFPPIFKGQHAYAVIPQSKEDIRIHEGCTYLLIGYYYYKTFGTSYEVVGAKTLDGNWLEFEPALVNKHNNFITSAINRLAQNE